MSCILFSSASELTKVPVRLTSLRRQVRYYHLWTWRRIEARYFHIPEAMPRKRGCPRRAFISGRNVGINLVLSKGALPPLF